MAELDMDEIVRLLHEVHGSRDAYVEQTGGNTATIYAGPRYPDRDGDGERQAALAGPGHFTGPRWTLARARSYDFYIGPDDQGDAWPQPLPVDADEAYAARVIAVQARLADPSRMPTAEEWLAAGLQPCAGGTAVGDIDRYPTGNYGDCPVCGLHLRLGDDGVTLPHLPKAIAGQPIGATTASELVRALLAQIAEHGDRPVHGLDSGVDKVFRGVIVGGFTADGLDDDSGPAIVMNLAEYAKYRQKQGDAIE